MFTFFTLIVSNEGFLHVETRGHRSWRGGDDERDVKQVVKSSEGGEVEASVSSVWV